MRPLAYQKHFLHAGLKLTTRKGPGGSKLAAGYKICLTITLYRRQRLIRLVCAFGTRLKMGRCWSEPTFHSPVNVQRVN